jgi:hypothetical protein
MIREMRLFSKDVSVRSDSRYRRDET